MSEQFKYLFTPLKIGTLTVRNRIVSTGHGTQLAESHLPSERLAYYHAERAKGGVGLIVMEGTSIHPTNVDGDHMMFGFDERAIPEFKRVADMVHEYGAKIFGQLHHRGIHNYSDHSRLPVLGPSDVPGVLNLETPKEMEIEDIEEIIEAYGKTANNFKESGVDGVEIHSAHSYLPMQFLSPLYNKRKDEYGGSLENRMRFLLRVVDHVRKTVGQSFTVGIRISSDELIPGGLTIDDMKIVAKRLEETGKIDFIDVAMGSHHTYSFIIAPMYVPPGYEVSFTAQIKEVVGLPVFIVGRVTDPVLAESILAEGKADMVAMTRALIADPELPNKAREGRLDDIRACVGDMQDCVGMLLKGRGIGCIQNPAVSKEKEWGIGTLKPTEKRKRVLVVGGGPAGMEAARVAALRGHEVILYEKEQELGGQVNLAAKLPGREEISQVARWLELQLKKLGVKVILGKEVTPEVVDEVKPDAVVVATGAEHVKTGFTGFLPQLQYIPGSEQENVVTPEAILKGQVKAGKKVVILDEDGFIVPLGIAELLASEGSHVEVLTFLTHVGGYLDFINRGIVYRRVLNLGVKLSPLTYMKEISGNNVVAYNIYTREERRIEGVDTVMLATRRKANNELYEQLKGRVAELYAVGDCVAPRRIGMAIYEGQKIGRQL